jgi:hypothetical protein
MKLICNCCGASFKPWKGYTAPDNESNECNKCRMAALREYVLLIEDCKRQVRESLTDPVKVAKFDSISSQGKKILVFQLWELGLFTFRIKQSSEVNLKGVKLFNN